MTELNEILEGSPSRFAFRMLRALLDTWPEETGRDEAIRLAESALGRWPARTRHVSAGNNRRMSAILGRPSWSLVRSLRWAPLGDATTLHVVTDVTSDPNAEHLRRLFLDYPSDEILGRLRLRACFPRVVALSVELDCASRRQAVIPFLNSGLPQSLRYLRLNGIERLDNTPSYEVPEIIDVLASFPVSRRFRAISLTDMSEVTLDHFIERFQIRMARG